MAEDTILSGGEFDAFLGALAARMSGNAFNSWMGGLRLESRSGDAVVISTDSKFKSDMLGQRYLMVMLDAWREAVGPVRRIDIVARERLIASAAKVTALMPRHIGLGGQAAALKPREEAPAPRPGDDKRAPELGDIISPLDDRSTFERFAVDDSNRLACAAARQVVSAQAVRETVYIYGPSGVGKTHLLHAIGNEWRAQRGSGCAYLPYANLQTGCVSAIFSNAMLALHKDLLAQDVVLIDDVHLLVGSNRTQAEILNLVNASLAAGKRLVIAGELAPMKLVERGLSERLADRLAGGLCVPITPADETLRLAVLKKRLVGKTEKCDIADDVIEYIARRFAGSMREAIGGLNQVLLAFAEEPRRVDLATASATLSAFLADTRRAYSLEDCAAAAARAFSMTLADLKGRAQNQAIVRGRHAYVYVAREVLRESFPRIASVIGRDHSTIMNGYERALALLERDKKFQAGVAEIKAALGA